MLTVRASGVPDVLATQATGGAFVARQPQLALANPDGPRFELFLARYNALDQDRKIGSLLVNPGGPGFGGTDLAFFAAQIFDRGLCLPSGAGLSDADQDRVIDVVRDTLVTGRRVPA